MTLKRIGEKIAILIFMIMIGCHSQQEANSHAKILWNKGDLLASEDFSNGLDDWMPEGDVSAEIQNGRLRFEALDNEVKKGNIWWKKKFSGPVLIEYEYQSATPHGLSMIWWNADGNNHTDLLQYKRSGAYEEYVAGNMDGYHCSYHRFDSGISSLRKSHGFHRLSTVVDPIPVTDTNRHMIQIYSQENEIRFLVDGILIHSFTDTGQPCIAVDEWLHEGRCNGTGDPLTQGYVGVRHTQQQTAFYDNFKVYRLIKP